MPYTFLGTLLGTLSFAYIILGGSTRRVGHSRGREWRSSHRVVAPTNQTWQNAFTVIKEFPEIQVWGVTPSYLNGVYRFQPSEGVENGPCFQHQGKIKDVDLWLFFATDGKWWIGGVQSKDLRKPSGWLASTDRLKPGKHPFEVRAWEAYAKGSWKKQPHKLMWLPEEAASEWQRGRDKAEAEPVVYVGGAVGPQVNGKYDFWVTEGGPGDPPVYRHQMKRYKWLYFGTDGQWWTGPTEWKDKRENRGWMHSVPVAPGTLPHEVKQWKVWSDNTFVSYDSSVKVTVRPDVQTAAQQWKQARSTAAPTLEIWGVASADINGRYELQPLEIVPETEPFVYRHAGHSDVWLYVGIRDGKWWIGQEEAKDQGASRGWMHSGYVQPGTSPEAAEDWEFYGNKAWNYVDKTFFWTPSTVAAEWEKARATAETHPVVEILNGTKSDSYSYMAAEGSATEPPVYQQQANSSTWLFVAHDGQYWVGPTEAKEKRQPFGVLHSKSCQPGDLPTMAQEWHSHKGGGWTLADQLEVK